METLTKNWLLEVKLNYILLAYSILTLNNWSSLLKELNFSDKIESVLIGKNINFWLWSKNLTTSVAKQSYSNWLIFCLNTAQHNLSVIWKITNKSNIAYINIL